MCTKIRNYNYKIEDAAQILSDQFTYVNVLQINFIFNNHQHISVYEILDKLNILLWAIQYISEDNRIVRATIVFDSKKVRMRTILTILKNIEKEHNKDKNKLYIIT